MRSAPANEVIKSGRHTKRHICNIRKKVVWLMDGYMTSFKQIDARNVTVSTMLSTVLGASHSFQIPNFFKSHGQAQSTNSNALPADWGRSIVCAKQSRDNYTNKIAKLVVPPLRLQNQINDSHILWYQHHNTALVFRSV